MDDIARSYILLAHAIEQHNHGYIDGYYGPPELARTDVYPLDQLAREADELAAVVAALNHAERRTFLEAQVRAMQTSIALLRGEPIPYREEVRRLYDIEPARVPEQEFEQAHAVIAELLPGDGPLAEREQQFRARFVIPPERMQDLFDQIVAELARRTRARFELPAQESFEVQFVQNQPWSGYNWYLGDNRSRIDINTDLPKYLTDLPDLIAHEAYPGHHTEHAIKDQRLYREQGRGEHSILLINAPECVVSEGIATRALRVVMDQTELRDWLAGDLAARAGLPDADIDAMLALHKARNGMRAVTENAALMLHEDGANNDEVVAYLQRYRLATPEEARKSIEFITHPNFRSYIFTYTRGGALLDQLFERGDKTAWFARLLNEPVTPGTIRAWSQV
ncbi:MAG: hypothetical protein OHK0022_24740 [Roseiflexaceae bacterium]